MQGIFLRRARMRSLKEGLVQSLRVEALENDAKDDAERFQDYGYAANPVDGQGLVINVGGHTIVLRLDRLAERPRLAAYEVSVWHKEGHNVTLRAGKLVEVNCDTFKVNAAVVVELNTPTVAMSAEATVGDTLAVANGITGGGNATFAAGRVSAQGMTAGGKALEDHTHPDLSSGGNTGVNN
jgi:phage baseplate assembly protein V